MTARLVMYERLSGIGPFGQRDRKAAEVAGRQRGRIGFATCETIEKRMEGRHHGSRCKNGGHPGADGPDMGGYSFLVQGASV